MKGTDLSRILKYKAYIRQHVDNVILSWYRFLRPAMIDSLIITDAEASHIDNQIKNHDFSKYCTKEFYPYLDHFYPGNSEQKNDDDFDTAWLHHQKNNSHHWQYHVLIRDGGELCPLDMPVADIAEMVCDWHSFSMKDKKSTAYSWYQDNKDKTVLSDNTKKLVEQLIEFVKEPLI